MDLLQTRPIRRAKADQTGFTTDDEAAKYYSRLFGARRHKQRPGYANFALKEPPLKLMPFENPQTPERFNHLGVEVLDKATLDSAVERLEANGIAAITRSTAIYCSSEQDKICSLGQDNERWERCQVVDDTAEIRQAKYCV